MESVDFQIAHLDGFSGPFDVNFVQFPVAQKTDFFSFRVKFGVETAFFRIGEQP
jgi:hypothetical protein